MDTVIQNLEQKMEKTFEALLHNFTKLRTGRASASILDDIKVDYYGASTPIKQLCNISIPEPRLIVIQPWDKSTLSEIEKAILAANLGITPDNDGNVVRLPFQPLTEDKRKQIVSQMKKIAEDAKIAARNLRRESNDIAKKMKKEGEISEDEEKVLVKKIQDITDSYIAKISDAASNKEKELMEV